MAGLLRIALVWLAAIAFAANGVAGQQCLAAQQQAPVTIAADHHAHGIHDTMQAGHGHHHETMAAGHQHPAGGKDIPASSHDCGKCLCIATCIVQSTDTAELTFAMSPVSFSSLAERHPDRPVDPEPGIPKL